MTHSTYEEDVKRFVTDVSGYVPHDLGFEIHIDWLEAGDTSLRRLGMELRIDWSTFPRHTDVWDMIFMSMPIGTRIRRWLPEFPGLQFCHFIWGSFAIAKPAPKRLLRRLKPLTRHKEEYNV